MKIRSNPNAFIFLATQLRLHHLLLKFQFSFLLFVLGDKHLSLVGKEEKDDEYNQQQDTNGTYT